MEVLSCLGKRAVNFITRLFNLIIVRERTPEEWKSILIFKNGEMMSCTCRGSMLMNHTMKIWERVVEVR